MLDVVVVDVAEQVERLGVVVVGRRVEVGRRDVADAGHRRVQVGRVVVQVVVVVVVQQLLVDQQTKHDQHHR